MELLTLVRDIDNAPDNTAPERIARSRAQVLEALAERPRRRARWVWGGSAVAGSLAAAGIVTAIVVGTIVAPVATQPASAAAVQVLGDAAKVVIAGVDPVVGPGQYLRIRETYELVSLWDIDENSDLSDPLTGFNTPTFTTSEGAVHARGSRDLYVPSDRSNDWILDDRTTNEVLAVYGDDRTLPAYERMVAAHPQRDADPGGLDALPGGMQEWDPDFDDDDQYWDPLRESYDEMPRDPQDLLGWYRENLTTSSDDWYLFQAIGRFLSTDVMPADLRAASLRVLGLLGGVDVARTVDGVTTLEMPAQLDEGGEFGDLLVSELDIDTSTGRIVGSREVYPHRGTDLLPAGIPWVSWHVEVAVVDEAPAP